MKSTFAPVPLELSDTQSFRLPSCLLLVHPIGDDVPKWFDRGRWIVGNRKSVMLGEDKRAAARLATILESYAAAVNREEEAVSRIREAAYPSVFVWVNRMFHLEGEEQIAFAEMLLERLPRFLIPVEEGGFASEYPVPFGKFVTNSFVVELITGARQGDEAALKRLRTLIDPPLRKTLLGLDGISAGDLDDHLESIWTDGESRILSETGFTLQTSIRFHTFVMKASPWTKRFRRRKKKDLQGDVGQDGGDDENDVVGNIPDRKSPNGAFNLIAREKRMRVIWLICQEHTGTPHQQLAYILAKGIHGKMSPKGFLADTETLNELYGTETFFKIKEQLPLYLKLEEELPPGEDREAVESKPHMNLDCRINLAALPSRLEQAVSQVLKKDPVNRASLKDYAEDPMGELWFRLIYGEKHQALVSDWCYKVERKIKRFLHGKGIESEADWDASDFGTNEDADRRPIN